MGNFGKSIALNCKESNITPIIFLPKNTDTNIIKEIVSLGGCTIVSDFNNIEDINKDAQLFALKYNYYFVNQLDDDIEVYYQKMFADKILDELNSIDYIVTYIGTGTLAKSLISLAKGSQVQVVGVIEKGRELKPTIKKMDLQIHELEFDRVIDYKESIENTHNINIGIISSMSLIVAEEISKQTNKRVFTFITD